MIRLSLATATLIALSIATPTLAQTTPRNQRPPAAEARYEAAYQHGQRFAFEAFLDRNGNPLPSAPLERVDIANRLSVLIELGRCDEARTLANAEGTRAMSLRVRQLCRAARR